MRKVLLYLLFYYLLTIMKACVNRKYSRNNRFLPENKTTGINDLHKVK